MNVDQPREAADAESALSRSLSALVDNELSTMEREALLDRIGGDAGAQARVANYRAQNAALKALYPVRQQDMRCVVVSRRAPWWRRVAVAASWLAAGIGLGLMPGWHGAPLNAQPSFVRNADRAYAVYAPEKRHAVEVQAAETSHLVRWLSARLDRQLMVPSLQEYGYAFVGGRLLPGESSPAAQFMYQDDQGKRLTLYITASRDAPGPPSRDASGVGHFRDGQRITFYWRAQGMAYAVSGHASDAHLRNAALEVCNAVGGNPSLWQ